MALTDYFETAGLTWPHWLAAALALVSGVIHLVLGVMFFPQGTAIAFLLAGVGFFGGLVLALLNYRRQLLYLVGVVFVAVQVVAFYFINYRNQPAFSLIEGIDKVAQVVLIVVLIVLYRREA